MRRLQAKMDKLYFLNLLVCLSMSSICTTAIVDKLVFEGIANERFIEENFERSLKAHSAFFVIDGIGSIILLFGSSSAWVIFALTFAQWFASAWAYYYNNKMIEEIATVELENKLRNTNIVRAVIAFGRFVCIFGFCVELLYRDD